MPQIGKSVYKPVIKQLAQRIIFIVVITYSPLSIAKLAPVWIAQVVNDSELIAIGTPVYQEGLKSEFVIEKVIKGKEVGNKITIVREREVHDQSFIYLIKHYVFLKKNADGSYKGAVYGRGLWPILGVLGLDGKYEKDCRLGVPNAYPITYIKTFPFLQARRMKITYPFNREDVEGEVLCKKDIEAAIEGIMYVTE